MSVKHKVAALGMIIRYAPNYPECSALMGVRSLLLAAAPDSLNFPDFSLFLLEDY
jgi:hypothetical protein